jgi:hypothetical protein
MNDSSHQREQCAVCSKDVSDIWFARLRNGEGLVKVCSPACSIRYIEGLPSAGNNGAAEFAPGGRTPRFLVNGELWS